MQVLSPYNQKYRKGGAPVDLLKRISDLLTARGWTEYALAEKSGIPASTINSWFSQKKASPKLVTLEKLCKGFEISLSEFFLETEERTVTLTKKQMELLTHALSCDDEEIDMIIKIIDKMNKS